MFQLKINSIILFYGFVFLFYGFQSHASINNCETRFLELANPMMSIISAPERSRLGHDETFITDPDTGIRTLQFVSVFLRNGIVVHGIYNGSHDGALIIRSFDLDQALGEFSAYAQISKENISHIDVHAYGFQHYSDAQGMLGFRQGEKAVFRVAEDLAFLSGFSLRENIKIEGIVEEETDRYIKLKVTRVSSIRGVDAFSEESRRNSEHARNIGKYYLVYKNSEFHWIGDWNRIVEVNPLPRTTRERIRDRVLPAKRAAIRWWRQF